MLKRQAAFAIVMGLFTAGSAVAHDDHHAHAKRSEKAQTTATATTDALADGVVKTIDAATGQITLQHGPLANIKMPGMTMPFKVKDLAWLKTVKVGDTVQFRAEYIDGAYTIVELQAK